MYSHLRLHGLLAWPFEIGSKKNFYTSQPLGKSFTDEDACAQMHYACVDYYNKQFVFFCIDRLLLIYILYIHEWRSRAWVRLRALRSVKSPLIKYICACSSSILVRLRWLYSNGAIIIGKKLDIIRNAIMILAMFTWNAYFTIYIDINIYDNSISLLSQYEFIPKMIRLNFIIFMRACFNVWPSSDIHQYFDWR